MNCIEHILIKKIMVPIHTRFIGVPGNPSRQGHWTATRGEEREGGNNVAQRRRRSEMLVVRAHPKSGHNGLQADLHANCQVQHVFLDGLQLGHVNR